MVYRDDVLPALHRGVPSHRRQAIGNGGDDRDALRVRRVDQAGEELAYAIAAREEVLGLDLRRQGATSNGGFAGCLYAPGQRRHVGAVQIMVIRR